MIRFTPTARARFCAWLNETARPTVRLAAVEADALDIIRIRAETGKTLSYELGRQYTTTGRAEVWTAVLADIDAPTWTLAEFAVVGMPFGSGPTQAAALDDATENAYIQTKTARDTHPSRDWLLSELSAGRLAWSVRSGD